MRKVMGGFLFDSDKARKIGIWLNPKYSNEFVGFFETLFQSRSGRFFVLEEVVGEDGGLVSGYSAVFGNDSSEAHNIRPLTSEQARMWTELHLTPEEYMKEFGPVDEAAAGEKIQTAFNLSAMAIDILKKQKAETGMTLSQLVELAVIEIYKV